jgi:hypothetical protein
MHTLAKIKIEEAVKLASDRAEVKLNEMHSTIMTLLKQSEKDSHQLNQILHKTAPELIKRNTRTELKSKLLLAGLSSQCSTLITNFEANKRQVEIDLSRR